MKLSIDINQQNALFLAFTKLDGSETMTLDAEGKPKTIRVPYRIGGAARRIIVKNMNALRVSLASYEEAHKALFREIWPDAAEDARISKEADPDKFATFVAEQKKLIEAKDDLDILPLPESVIYGDNEFPADALLILEQHGLIAEAAPASA